MGGLAVFQEGGVGSLVHFRVAPYMMGRFKIIGQVPAPGNVV
jgi:hypothetical protein